MDKYPEWNLDFWRSLLNPDRRVIFPASGTGPKCGNKPGPCTDSTYIPKQCQAANSNCTELWHIDSSYSPNVYQRIIDGLQLPLTINFLGGLDNTKAILNDAMAKKKAILFYFWTPGTYVAVNNFTKLLFPSNNPTEYGIFSKDNTKPLTTDPQSIILQKLMSPKFATDFPELPTLATRFQIDPDSMNTMLKQMGGKTPLTASQAACQWVQKNINVWSAWVPPVPKSNHALSGLVDTLLERRTHVLRVLKIRITGFQILLESVLPVLTTLIAQGDRPLM
ncbi:hypothetical protein BCR33DRAFT_580695 [Rhizoclosmatium globosum]|uniref:ABC-type glycine betaine transport system substrate-binding domain-containing protein n=1 Tax=Rhizoclosmatium globosum TaxID=329046 RepID=A0A1Y2CSI9_9FUNG|nr:hypothetical protein BCR33DRAFT_580695 [Rhizoclosmatium globosum]|eukprot:ORY49345.1 hypothetical protein BCR33DRAFT_580695 [Rhizoclosmatium globosum]